MSIIKDIADAFDEVKNALGSMRKSPDAIMGAGQNAASEKRFFSRPIDSVARRAKQSILHFPIVGSESLSTETITTLAKASQVLCTEYVRLMVGNLDPVEAASQGKTAVIAALRGGTLKDAFLTNEDVDANSAFLTKHIGKLEELTFIEDGLNEPLLNESDRDPPGFTPARRPYRSSIPETPEAMFADDPLSMDGVMDSLVDYNNGTERGRQDALKQWDKAVKDNFMTAADIMKIRAGGYGPLIDEYDRITKEKKARTAEKERLEMELLRAKHNKMVAQAANAQNKAQSNNSSNQSSNQSPKTTPEQQAAMDRARDINNAKKLANRGTPHSREAATEAIRQLMATGDGSINGLRRDPACAAIINMLERLPSGVVRDGSYDISGTVNTVKLAPSIDYNRLNQFPPVLLDMKIRYKTAAGEPLPITDSITLGVKSVIHVVPSMDIVTGLGTALQRDSFILQFFRMTSGETSFLQDFVLNLKVAKLRASAKTTAGAKAFETLRRQAEWNNRRESWLVAAISKRNFVPPTTTLVITSDEAEKIKSLYGTDFTKPSSVRELMKSHNLMGFIIVDETLGLARIFEDGDDDFDRLPLSVLKAQGKETSVKDIMTIMARS